MTRGWVDTDEKIETYMYMCHSFPSSSIFLPPSLLSRLEEMEDQPTDILRQRLQFCTHSTPSATATEYCNCMYTDLKKITFSIAAR